MADRIRFLYIPFVLTFIVLIVGYTFLHWLLFIRLELFSIKEIFLNYFIPLILSGIAAWFVLRAKLKIFNFGIKHGSWKDLYCVILWATLTIPLMITQEYMCVATGKLTVLDSISEIDQYEPARYYILKNYHINKDLIGVHTTFTTSGKYNQNFVMRLYTVLPVFEKADDLLNQKVKAWLGLMYLETISNRLEQEKKENIYLQFARECQANFEHRDVSEFYYLERIGNSHKKDGYIQAIGKSPFPESDQVIFTAVNEPFEARTGNKLWWILGTSIIGFIIYANQELKL